MTSIDVSPARLRPFSPAEIAELFGVDTKTATRWAKEGRLEAFRTPGGHWRFKPDAVRAALVAT